MSHWTRCTGNSMYKENVIYFSTDNMDEFIDKNFSEYINLIKTITAIPAPYKKEEKRAEFVSAFLKDMGFEPVTDSENNVILSLCRDWERGCSVCKKYRDCNRERHVYMAHLDTVFSDENIQVTETEDGKLTGPGVGDDTTNVAALLFAVKYIKEKKICIKDNLNVLVCFDTGEEGLGNLRGCRKLMESYDNITQVIAFDLGYDKVNNVAVGSKRYKITVKTSGGHSYNDFGSDNAIKLMADIIELLYGIDTVKMPGKTTYNVGLINGGTSVNTIASEASVLYEFRSDSKEGLDMMEKEFMQIIERLKRDYNIEVEKTGDRPSMGRPDRDKMRELTEKSVALIENVCGIKPQVGSLSTDCNIPLSMGIPSICYGAYLGGGAHTKNEYVETDSLKKGLKIVINSLISDCNIV